MEYAGALGTIIFDEYCRLCDLTEAQVGRNQFAINMAVDHLDERIDEVEGRADHVSERLLALEGQITNMEAGYTKLLALGQEQVKMSTQSCQALTNLATVAVTQQGKICELEERMDAMREMLLVLEHMQENLLMVDDEETTVSDRVVSEELKVEENEVAIPIPVPGQLVPIKEAVQVLPNELVGTQITFELANEDRPPSYK